MLYTDTMDHRYRKFLAVADTGSFSEAAKLLHVTQPAVTLAVASLERAFGTKLCVRKKYAIELTDDGRVVAASARRIASEIGKMEQRLHESAAGAYHVGIIDSIAHLLYASPKENQLLSNLDVMVDNSRRIISDITANKIDAGLITGQPGELDKNIHIRKLKNEEFVFVCAPSHASAGLKSVTKIDDWLAFDKESTSFKYFSKQFKKIGLHVTPVFYSTSMELIKEMATAGKGTALLPRHIVQGAVDSGGLAIVKTKPLGRPIWAIMRSEQQAGVINNLSARINSLLAGNS